MPNISFFGNSKIAPSSIEYQQAESLSKELATRGIGIITGGYGGIMEAALKGASEFDVPRIGIVLKNTVGKEANKYINKLIEKDSYLERNADLVQSADGCVIFPGGTGTMLELAAAWALKERGYYDNKPIVCIGEQWNEVIQTLSFYSEKVLDNSAEIQQVDNVEDALTYILKELNIK